MTYRKAVEIGNQYQIKRLSEAIDKYYDESRKVPPFIRLFQMPEFWVITIVSVLVLLFG